MSKIRRFLPWIIIAVLVIAALVGYSVLFLKPREVNRIRIGYSAMMSATTIPDLVAREIYLPEYGIVAEPLYFEGSDPLNVKAVLGGTVDIGGITGGISIIAAIEAGANLKVFACPSSKPTFLLVSKDTIQSAKDLEGKSIGIAAPGSDSHVLAVIVLEHEGVDVEGIDWLQIGGTGSRAKALLAGKIDAALLTPLVAIELLRTEGFHILVSVPEAVPDYVFGGYFATEEYIEKHPDIILAVTKALIRATRWAQDKAVYLEKAQEEFPEMSPETISDTYNIYIENRFWSTNGGLGREVADFTYELAVRLGVAKEKKPMETWITMEFVEKALEELGTYEPSTLSILAIPQATPTRTFNRSHD